MRYAKRTRSFRSAFLLFLVLLLSSCGTPPEFIASYSPEDSQWYATDTARWVWQVADTARSYDLMVEIRHSTNYPYANLYLFVEIEGPGGGLVSDTLNYPLCAPTGEWYGEGFGSTRTLQLPYRIGSRFAQTGEYTFNVRQGMRAEPLTGIREVSLIVYKHQDGEE